MPQIGISRKSRRQQRLAWWRSLSPAQQEEFQKKKEAEREMARLDTEFREIVR